MNYLQKEAGLVQIHLQQEGCITKDHRKMQIYISVLLNVRNGQETNSPRWLRNYIKRQTFLQLKVEYLIICIICDTDLVNKLILQMYTLHKYK